MESVAKFTRQSVATVSFHASRKRRMSEQVVKDYAELFSVMSAEIFVELNENCEFELSTSDPEDCEPSLTTPTKCCQSIGCQSPNNEILNWCA